MPWKKFTYWVAELIYTLLHSLDSNQEPTG